MKNQAFGKRNHSTGVTNKYKFPRSDKPPILTSIISSTKFDKNDNINKTSSFEIIDQLFEKERVKFQKIMKK